MKWLFNMITIVIIWIIGYFSYPIIKNVHSSEELEKTAIFQTISTLDFLRADVHDAQSLQSSNLTENIFLNHTCIRLKEMRKKYLSLDNRNEDNVDLSSYAEDVIEDLNKLNISKSLQITCVVDS